MSGFCPPTCLCLHLALVCLNFLMCQFTAKRSFTSFLVSSCFRLSNDVKSSLIKVKCEQWIFDLKKSVHFLKISFKMLFLESSLTNHGIYRSSHQKCSIKRVKNSAKFTGKHLCQSPRPKACNFIKKETLTQFFFL